MGVERRSGSSRRSGIALARSRPGRLPPARQRRPDKPSVSPVSCRRIAQGGERAKLGQKGGRGAETPEVLRKSYGTPSELPRNSCGASPLGLTRFDGHLGGAVRMGVMFSLFVARRPQEFASPDRKSTRLNSSHLGISYA